jgi:hypothetical protein
MRARRSQTSWRITRWSQKLDAHNWRRSADCRPMRPGGQVQYGNNRVQEIVSGTLGAFRGAAGVPGIVPASGHVEDPAHQTQRILETQRPHERVPGRCALATYAVAFFRMSRSMRVKYLVENGPLHCARVAGHLKEGPPADHYDQRTDDTEDRQTLSPHHQEPSRHRALRNGTWD